MLFETRKYKSGFSHDPIISINPKVVGREMEALHNCMIGELDQGRCHRAISGYLFTCMEKSLNIMLICCYFVPVFQVVLFVFLYYLMW